MMKIAVVCANGKAGQLITEEALKSILVICQELFGKKFDMFFGKRVTLTDLR